MKNKNGFTMMELLAVIVILGIVSTIAILTVTRILKKNKEKALEAKEEIILKQARQYAKDNEEDLFYNSGKRYQFYVCDVITIGDLVNAGYIDEDDKDVDGGGKDVINPLTNQSMKDRKIMVYIRSKENPSSPNYSSLGIYNGTIISAFDTNQCKTSSGSDVNASSIHYDNSYTHVDCDDVQCMLDYIAGMIYD